MTEWRHVLTWSYGPTAEVSHAVNQDSNAQQLRMMIELAGVTAERCRRELAAKGEEP